jgi:hypothetical protein
MEGLLEVAGLVGARVAQGPYDVARRASCAPLSWASTNSVRWSCRTEICHTCETALVAETVGYGGRQTRFDNSQSGAGTLTQGHAPHSWPTPRFHGAWRH